MTLDNLILTLASKYKTTPSEMKIIGYLIADDAMLKDPMENIMIHRADLLKNLQKDNEKAYMRPFEELERIAQDIASTLYPHYSIKEIIQLGEQLKELHRVGGGS
jgi:hypothetical protein